MSSIKTAQSTNTVENAGTTATSPADLRPDLLRRERIPASVRDLAGGGGMSDTIRTIIWVTGVAFGVYAPGAFAQSAFDADATQKNSVSRKLDAKVQLAGSVDGKVQIARAGKIAAGKSGVTSVLNDPTVK